MTSKSKRFCSVPQCNTYVGPGVSLHYFPKDSKLRRKWGEVLKIGKPISKYMNVCSRHFSEQDFIPSAKVHTKCPRLKVTAIPSKNLPVGSHDRKLPKQKRNSRRLSELNKPVREHESTMYEEAVDHNCQSEMEVEITKPTETDDIEPTEIEHTELSTTEKKYLDQGTQTDESSFYSLMDVLNTDEKLKAFTSVNFNVFGSITECARNVALHNIKSVGNLQLKIAIVLIRLRLNIPFTCLAILFNLSTSSVSRYFYSTLSLLAVAVKPAIYWPSKQEILSNMPKCFNKYRNTRVVLDATEIPVDKCKCLRCRILTYSHYKGRHTIKFLIGITPSGVISFLSSGYGGRTSDKKIFNKEKIVDKLHPYDGIMVDKGVLIEKECEENLLHLIRPPFLRKRKQFSKAEAEETSNIARARVHVERAIERIKTFTILNNQLSWYMVPYVNEIMTVVAALVNLSPPILADDKFIHNDFHLHH